MPSFVASPEVPCARCGTRVAGLAWGEECRNCQKLLRTRARRLASRISVVAALLLGLDIWLRIPGDSPLRVYGGIAVLVTYLLVYQIASRVAMVYLAREPRKEVSDA